MQLFPEQLKIFNFRTNIYPENESSPIASNFDSKNMDQFVVIKARRSTVIAIAISILIHGIALFAYYPKTTTGASSIARSLPKNISVSFAELPAKKSPSPIKPKLPQPVAIAMEKRSPIAMPQNAAPAKLAAENTAPKDFMSFVQSKRQHNQELEEYAARVNSNDRELSADELRDENIKRNLQQSGTSGIFEIKYKSINNAQFSFKGWKNSYSIPKVERVDVAVGADGDIDLAIVKKMIEIIRREYKGDFNWESQRLGRVIVLSARLGDNSGLEEFLKNEFFATEKY